MQKYYHSFYSHVHTRSPFVFINGIKMCSKIVGKQGRYQSVAKCKAISGLCRNLVTHSHVPLTPLVSCSKQYILPLFPCLFRTALHYVGRVNTPAVWGAKFHFTEFINFTSAQRVLSDIFTAIIFTHARTYAVGFVLLLLKRWRHYSKVKLKLNKQCFILSFWEVVAASKHKTV